MRGLQHRFEADDLKRDLLRTNVQAGIDALDGGACTEVDDSDLDAALDGLVAPAR